MAMKKQTLLLRFLVKPVVINQVQHMLSSSKTGKSNKLKNSYTKTQIIQ